MFMINDFSLAKGLMLLSAFFLMSCSVKEDRTDCPCCLHLDFSGTDTTAVPQVQLYLSDGLQYISDKMVYASDFMPEIVLEVPRTGLYVNVYAGAVGLLEPDAGLVIPYGHECPRLYSYSAEIDTRCEKACAKVDLRKNHCVMSITIIKNDELDYGLHVKGNVCGYDAAGEPVPGAFSYVPAAETDGRYRTVLPRQVDSSLILEVDDGTEVLKNFALGEYIAAGGYDWTAQDLEDVDVTIDWAQTVVKLKVQGWDWVREYEIVI